MTLYSDYHAGGPTKNLSMLDLLDRLNLEYTRFNNLGQWTKRENPQILALTATISNLQSQLSAVKSQYSSMQALLAKTTKNNGSKINDHNKTKLQKPPPKQVADPEITTFQNLVWKWCDKCFGGTWNRTHVTAKHVAGVGKRNRCNSPPNNKENNKSADAVNQVTPQANLAQATPDDSTTPEAQANLASENGGLDFL